MAQMRGSIARKKHVGIMQPYFLPYIGYFQLIAAVDQFVIYDNIKYTKKGWINRNRILRDGKDVMFSLPLVKASDDRTIQDREIAPNFEPNTFLAQMKGAYGKAPYFDQTQELLDDLVHFPERNLFRFIAHSIRSLCRHLDIATEIVVSSTVQADHGSKGKDRVLAICRACQAEVYVNPSGGADLYDRAEFASQGVDLRFIRSRPIEYEQFGAPFVPWLSIIDVLMFNGRERVAELLGEVDYF